MPHRVLGLDVGGANLKAADVSGHVETMPFPLWKDPGTLPDALIGLARRFDPAELWAVTMTGELCDCFASKADGVHAIIDAVLLAAKALGIEHDHIVVWQNDGEFVDVDEARRSTRKTAAANWVALAWHVARHLEGPGLLIDVGTTTTDVIPIQEGRPVPKGRTDLERLANRELLYEGVRRTPICAMLSEFGWHGGSIKPAAEFFATALDVYLLLGDVPEDAADVNTADGRPATRANAHARLARMLCADVDELPLPDAIALAQRVKRSQMQRLAAAIRHVGAQHHWRICVTGAGEFLAWQTAQSLGFKHVKSVDALADSGSALGNAATAYAIAMLAAERSPFMGPKSASAPACEVDYVIKVGGSLFDLAGLGPKLNAWLGRFKGSRVVLIPGGGQLADVIRQCDKTLALGSDQAHQLALHAMAMNGKMLETALPGAACTDTIQCLIDGLARGSRVIFCPDQWLRSGAEALPRSWDVTSDSIAAYCAGRWHAKELILLKSRHADLNQSWEQLAADGLVDAYFPKLASKLPSVRIVDFRAEP